MVDGNTVDRYGVDHSLMNGECTNLYDVPHGDGACDNLLSVGYRCRAYFCREGSDFRGFCDHSCECGACGTGPVCGDTRCSADQICSCDNVCMSPSAVGNGECDDELQETGRLLNCAENQWDGGDCAALYDRACSDHFDCTDGEVCSCEGKCAPGDWLGDGICDDASKVRGHDLDCIQFQDHPPTIAGTTRGDMGDCDWTRACGSVPGHAAWGSLACRETEVCSCVNLCEPMWAVGDGNCEEGQQNHHLNCARFEYDGGDCEGSTGCWDAQGQEVCANYFAQGMTCETQIGTHNADMVVSRLCQSTCDNCPAPEPEPEDLYVPPLPPTDLCAGVACIVSLPCKLAGVCDHSNGQCSAETDAPDGTDCDDGDPTTENDACLAGTCAGEFVPNECDAIQSAIVERCLYGRPSADLDHTQIATLPCEDCATQLDEYLTIVSDCILVVHENENLQQEQQLPMAANGLLAAAYLRTVTDNCVNPCQLSLDGTPCDDNDPTTDEDTCNAGICTGTEQVRPPPSPPPQPPFRPPPPPATPNSPQTQYLTSVDASALAASITDDYITYQLIATLGTEAANVYTIFGVAGSPLRFPPAYQCPTPFGSNIGGIDPQFFRIANNAAIGFSEYDSWLTVGITNGDASALSSIGLEFDTWTETTPLESEDGAVFWMAPDDGPGGEVVLAQITLPVALGPVRSASASFGMQGRSNSGPDYELHAIEVSLTSGIADTGTAVQHPPRTPPPPPPQPPPSPPSVVEPSMRSSGELFLDVAIEDIDALSSESRQALDDELRDYIASLFLDGRSDSPVVHAEDVVIESIRAGSVVVEFSVLDVTLDQLQDGLQQSVTLMYNVNFTVCSDGCILGYAVTDDSGVSRPPVYRNELPSDDSGTTTAATSETPPPPPTTLPIPPPPPAPTTRPAQTQPSPTRPAESAQNGSSVNATGIPSSGFERAIVGYHDFVKNVLVHHLAPSEEHLFDEWVRKHCLIAKVLGCSRFCHHRRCTSYCTAVATHQLVCMCS